MILFGLSSIIIQKQTDYVSPEHERGDFSEQHTDYCAFVTCRCSNSIYTLRKPEAVFCASIEESPIVPLKAASNLPDRW